jgi:hypothetical protein
MDNKTIFVKTRKGEDELHGKTSQLPGDLKRALLMVDGSSTFSEISKRAAPSMRASLGETLEQLARTGFIQDKDMVGKTPRIAVPPKMSVPGKMAVPSKMAKPQETKPDDEDAGELDFLTGFPVSPPEKPAIVPDNAKSLIDQTDEKSRRRWEAEKYKDEDIIARKEAEDKKRKAEQDAARIREETARRARQEAEAIRLKAEQEARKLREELNVPKLETGTDAAQKLEEAIRAQQQGAEAKRMAPEQKAKASREGNEPGKSKSELDTQQRLDAAIIEQQLAAEAVRLLTEKQARKEHDDLETARLKIEQEAKLRLEAATRERERAEAARIKAEQEAAQILLEMELAKQKAEQEAKARLEAEAKARLEAEAKARLEAEAKALARIKAEEEARLREAAELLARQEREEIAREAAKRAAEARQAAERASKGVENLPLVGGAEGFAFDQFQIDEPQNLAVPRKDDQPKKGAAKDAIALDAFQIDEQLPAEQAKARQPVQRSGPAQPAAAASESAKSRQDNEQENREEQDIENDAEVSALADAIARADDQTREIADAEAKVSADAEQRETLKANKAQATLLDDYSVPEPRRVERPVRVERVRRKPFSWGKLVGFVFKLGVFLVILLAAVLFIIPYTLPMRDYMPKVQQLLSARLHQPVHLGSLSGRILPMPRLDLGEIYIGDAKQFQAVDAQINFDLMGLFIDEKPISSVDFHGVKVRGPWVRDVSGWLQQLASQAQYPVSQITISQGTLDADVFQLNAVEANLNFDPAGKFIRGNISAEGGKYTMDLIAVPASRFETTITVHDSALPLLPNWWFDELVAKGELTKDQLVVKNFDAKILGGGVQGNAIIDWRSGWNAQGTMNAKAIVMQNISKLLDGKFDGLARFKANAADLAGFADSVSLDGSFKSGGGLLSGMDIVETARLHSKEHLPGGRTRYDQLVGDIAYADGAYHFSQVKVDADVMETTASFDIDKQQLSGKMSVKLSLHDTMAPVTLQIGGTTDSPTLVYPH